MNIIVLGPQGSGKGTQAELIAKKYNLEHIDIGGTLRAIAQTETSLGRRIYEIQNISKTLVPNEILKKIIHYKVASLNREKGIIFDGVPRTLEQAKFLEDLMLKFGRIIDKFPEGFSNFSFTIIIVNYFYWYPNKFQIFSNSVYNCFLGIGKTGVSQIKSQ